MGPLLYIYARARSGIFAYETIVRTGKMRLFVFVTRAYHEHGDMSKMGAGRGGGEMAPAPILVLFGRYLVSIREICIVEYTVYHPIPLFTKWYVHSQIPPIPGIPPPPPGGGIHLAVYIWSFVSGEQCAKWCVCPERHSCSTPKKRGCPFSH